MRIDFYDRPGCHLCEDALPIVQAEAAAAGAELVRHNIDEDAELMARFGEFIPVVLIDGVQHSQWFVDADKLRQALQ